MRSALVTGATGFIGSRLVRRLAEKRIRAHALVRSSSNVSDLERVVPEVGIHRYDGSFGSVLAAVHEANPDVVFHLAAQVQFDHEPGDIAPMIHANVVFGTQLLEALADSDHRVLVNTGTFWQHYEDREFSPVCLYAATKQAFECMLAYYIEARDVAAISLILYDTYGPGDPRQKLMNLLGRATQDGNSLELSGGEQLIDLVYIDDVLDAYLLAAETLRRTLSRGHRRYAVSSGAPLTLRHLIALYEDVTGTRVPVAWGARPYRDREIMVPWTRGTTLPGWAPRVELAEGIRRTHASFDS